MKILWVFKNFEFLFGFFVLLRNIINEYVTMEIELIRSQRKHSIMTIFALKRCAQERFYEEKKNYLYTHTLFKPSPMDYFPSSYIRNAIMVQFWLNITFSNARTNRFLWNKFLHFLPIRSNSKELWLELDNQWRWWVEMVG